MKVRNVIWIWQPVKCVDSTNCVCEHSISVCTFAGILVTQATAVRQTWDSCYHILWPIPKTWIEKTSDDVDDDKDDKVDHGGDTYDDDDAELSAPLILFDSPPTSKVGPIKIGRNFRQLNAVWVWGFA